MIGWHTGILDLLVIFLLYEHSCLGIFLCESEDDKLFVAFSLVLFFV